MRESTFFLSALIAAWSWRVSLMASSLEDIVNFFLSFQMDKLFRTLRTASP